MGREYNSPRNAKTVNLLTTNYDFISGLGAGEHDVTTEEYNYPYHITLI